ncbi:hypothetical protein HDV02_002073 [Globomyces sp. JEL0801]|nr:hypothetical protein HDV02_002073 [Globomyces sp. JEL0801]
MQWTDLCHHMAGELHSKGFKETDIRNALHTIPFVSLIIWRELNAFIGSKEYDRIVYIGDGRNDFCPSTKLRKQDLVLVRKGMGFAKKLQNPQDRKLIEAELIEWDTADEILTLFTKLMK